MKKTIQLIIAVIVISFAIGIIMYSRMPEQVASHWNAAGDVDGYMSKFWGLFLMPIVTLAIFLLFLAIPYIDPLKKNIEKFRKYFDWFIYMMVLFLFYIYMLTIGWNLGYRFNMTLAILPAFAILFFIIGIVVERAERNWFIGIRTPWTLSDDDVWKKTHRLGGKMFKACAVLAVIGMLLPRYSVWFVLVPVMFTALFTIIYSYVIFAKMKRKKSKKK
ncbi:DUF1648 domain-containing protein [Candidatus Woesearchaeota archaeon]|nr:DUF1648 domain-containing protein [Candidatus Woesearchaeota archaeon]